MTGLSRETGQRIAAQRRRAAFHDLGDFAKRVAPRRNETLILAEAGSLAEIDPTTTTRRSALWQVAAVERDPDSLFSGVTGSAEVGSTSNSSPLPELSALETTLADYRTTGLTTGPHVMSHLRPALKRRGVLATGDLGHAANGRWVRTAGHVIVRQRPGSAKGMCFLTLEDETGTANGVLTPDQFQRFRAPLHSAALLEIAGPIQNVDGVIHVLVRELRPLSVSDPLPDSHDFH